MQNKPISGRNWSKTHDILDLFTVIPSQFIALWSGIIKYILKFNNIVIVRYDSQTSTLQMASYGIPL